MPFTKAQKINGITTSLSSFKNRTPVQENNFSVTKPLVNLKNQRNFREQEFNTIFKPQI